MTRFLPAAAFAGALALACVPITETPSDGPLGAPSVLANPGLSIPDPRVWYDPYGGVQWRSALRLKAQTHDHTELLSARLLSYDSAGYAFVPIMDYSGVASLAYAQRRRLWPSDSVLPAAVRSRPLSVTWVPSAEEVGFQHVTSLFLTQYIAKWEPAQYEAKQEWMYESTQQAIDLVSRYGGFPILAHPWGAVNQFDQLGRYRGMEIYNAYAEHLFETKSNAYFATANRNRDILSLWDRVLLRGRFVIGVAVNDHYGPYRSLTVVSRRVRDSGKIIVLTPDRTLGAYQEAMLQGALFAVTDLGETKGGFPVFDSITVSDATIHAWTAAPVTWIADGVEVASGSPTLNVAGLAPTTRFVRAELRAADGSVVYSQPFLVRPHGDVDGDFRVGTEDDRICQAIDSNNRAADRTTRAACASRPRRGTR